MPYTDFTSAFTDWSSRYADARSEWGFAVVNFNDAYYFYGPATDFENSLALCVQNILNIMLDVLFDSGGPNYMDNSMYAAMYFAGQGAVDMQGIIDAMMKAEFAQLKQFIGIEDAYRATIWDQPFDSEFYANLVRTWRT